MVPLIPLAAMALNKIPPPVLGALAAGATALLKSKKTGSGVHIKPYGSGVYLGPPGLKKK